MKTKLTLATVLLATFLIEQAWAGSNLPPAVTPEPTAIAVWLLALGLGGVGYWFYRRRRS